MATLNKHKRGDTFYFDVVWEGAAADELRAQVRDAEGVLVTDLEVTQNEEGTFRFTAADTSDWPVGTLETDVQRTTGGGLIKSSDTLKIPVIKDVTRDE